MKQKTYVGYMQTTVENKKETTPILINIEGDKIKEYLTNITIGNIIEFNDTNIFNTKIDEIKILIRKTTKGNPIEATDEIIEAYKEINNNSEHLYNKLNELSLDKTYQL